MTINRITNLSLCVAYSMGLYYALRVRACVWWKQQVHDYDDGHRPWLHISYRTSPLPNISSTQSLSSSSVVILMLLFFLCIASHAVRVEAIIHLILPHKLKINKPNVDQPKRFVSSEMKKQKTEPLSAMEHTVLCVLVCAVRKICKRRSAETQSFIRWHIVNT